MSRSSQTDDQQDEDPEEDGLECYERNKSLSIAPTSPMDVPGSRSPSSSSESASPNATRQLTYNTYVGTSRDKNWVGIPPLYHHEDPYHPRVRLATGPRSADLNSTGLTPYCELYDNGKWPAPALDRLQSDYESDTDGNISDSDPAWKQMPTYLLPFVPYIEKPSDATSASTLRRRSKNMHVDTIRTWLQSCESQHGPRCCADSHHDRDISPVHPQYLIDVKQFCLVEAPQTGRFVALSYCWGKSDPAACATSANLERLLKDGGLRNEPVSIPRTVLDAIQLVERLGEKYLWCDRYCIVQDDSEAKYKQLATMGKIYASAFFTLVAAQNNDAEAGLYGRRKIVLEPATSLKRNKVDARLQSDVTGDQIMLDQAIGLMRTKWFSRGWTFQENHFSRRKVVFQDDTVNFECRNASWHEAQDISIVLSRTGDGASSDPSKSSTSFNQFDHPSWPDMLRYARLVSLFNERDFTFPEDIFDAFGGILQHLSTAFTGGFISGLPVLCFDAALLWQPWTPIVRRQSRKVNYDATLPSWSWGGWTGILQSEAWRSASNYQYVKDETEQCSWRTFSTVRWYYSETLTSDRHAINVPQQTVQPDSTASPAVDLPPGWSQSPSTNDKSTVLFYHTCDPSQAFRYPISICDKQGPPQPVVNARYLHCTTNRGYLKLGKTIPRWSSNCPAISLKTTFGRWAGVLRLPCKDHEVEEFVGKHKGRVELIEISAGSVENQKVEERSFDEWVVPSCPRHKGSYEFVNVLWIEWVDGVAYRRALGRVKKSAWGRLKKVRVDITLG